MRPQPAHRPPAIDERALKDKAHVLVRQGRFEAAAELYRLLILDNPKDASLRLHHGDLCHKLGRPDRAVAAYQVAAHLLSSQGHLARSRAALACGLSIAPHDRGLRRAMRDLAQTAQTAAVAEAPASRLALVPQVAVLPAPLARPRTSGGRHLSLAIPITDAEAVTEPYFPLPDWVDVSPDVTELRADPTVRQRKPRRV